MYPPMRRGTHLIMRQGLLWLSEQRRVFNFVRRNRLARKFASRFVAGETIEEAVGAARDLAQRGITASLDLLGESVTVESEAIAARDQYLAMLDRMAEAGERSTSRSSSPRWASISARTSATPT